MRWVAPWSASSGTQRSARPTPVPSRTRASTARMTPCLFGDDVLKGGPGKYGEDGVVQSQESQVAGGVRGHGGADAADDDRDRERQEEQRQEHLAGAAPNRHRRKQGAGPGEPQ